MHKAKLT